MSSYPKDWLYRRGSKSKCKCPETLEIEGLGQKWSEDHPNWVDPASVELWTEVRIKDGRTGHEIWRRTADGLHGDPHYRQIC